MGSPSAMTSLAPVLASRTDTEEERSGSVAGLANRLSAGVAPPPMPRVPFPTPAAFTVARQVAFVSRSARPQLVTNSLPSAIAPGSGKNPTGTASPLAAGALATLTSKRCTLWALLLSTHSVLPSRTSPPGAASPLSASSLELGIATSGIPTVVSSRKVTLAGSLQSSV